MADAAVRLAKGEDVDEIARIQVSTWRTGYAAILPPEVLAGLDEGAAAEQWRQAVDDGRVLVATEGPWIVGFCSSGPSPTSESAAANDLPAPDAATVALIGTLLVEPRWGRRGHGGRLLAAAAETALADGCTRGICWVPEANRASADFFKRAGWTPDGVARTLDAGGRPVREIRLTGSLRFELD